MPAKPTAKPKQPNWFDLLPDGAPRLPLEALLTREELLEGLHRRGVAVDQVTLMYWERRGVLPRAIRRYRDGRAHALYPPHAISAVAHLRELQAAGRTLEEISPLMRMWALSSIAWEDPLSKPLTRARAELLAVARSLGFLGKDVAGIRVAFTNDAGEEVFSHEMPIPIELREEPDSRG
jgi:DNA-binding transcriptional MerR regulator